MQRDPTIVSLIVGLIVLSAVFWMVERWRPSLTNQRRTRRETATDVAYWFFTPLVTKAVTRIALAVVLDKNFSGLFPFIDLAFGTFFMPEGRQPERFGIYHDNDIPDGLLGQLVYPFRRRRVPHR